MKRLGVFESFVVLLCICAVAVLAHCKDSRSTKGGCEKRTVSTSLSPDRIWSAVVREEICSDGAFTTSAANVVQLVRSGETETDEGKIFSADTGGHPENTPLLKWLAPRLLQITVPNKSLIGLSKSTFGDVNIQVKFDPDNPEERKRWLKEIGQEGSK